MSVKNAVILTKILRAKGIVMGLFIYLVSAKLHEYSYFLTLGYYAD